MAAGAWMSILGLYEHDNSIFNGMTVPSGVSTIDVVNTILLECAELEFLYPNPTIAKQAIRLWSNKEINIWKELQKTLEYNYDPIANVDATETETRNLTGSRIRNSNGTGGNTDQVSAFNASDFENRARQDSTYNDNTSDTLTDGGTITKTRKGNIGVTMTQQLIEAQRKVVEFNIIDYIVRSFKNRFCLQVY